MNKPSQPCVKLGLTPPMDIDLSAFGFTKGTGVAISPDGQSLYFVADFNTLVKMDLAGNLMATQFIGDTSIEDIDVADP